MTVRYSLSRLSRPESRRAAGRTWLALCAAGALLSLAVFGGRHLVFIVIVWTVVIFAPVRIAMEAFHALGPRLRERLRHDLLTAPDRYATPERAAVMVEHLYGQEVLLPRLAPPDLGPKVIEAASRLCARAFHRGRGPLEIRQAAWACGSLVNRWALTISAGESGTLPPGPATAWNGASSASLWDARASIQDQWVTLRAIAGLAALTRVLAAVYEDSTGSPLQGAPLLRQAADAVMDFADQVGLRLEGPAYEPPEGLFPLDLPHDVATRLAETWRAFCAAPLPAPRRLRAFLDAVPR